MNNKKRCQIQNFLDPPLLREKERAYGARDTYSHNFDFYVVQTAERAYVIVM